MVTKIPSFVPGDKINSITTIRLFKKIMLDLFRGYPAHEYYGIFESYFGKPLASRIIDILIHDGLIDYNKGENEEPSRYRLTAKGIDFAISMINLEYSERTLKYNKQMKKFTISVIILSVLTLFCGITSILVSLFS